MGRPTGITILGIFYMLGGIVWIFFALMFGVISVGFMGSSMMSGLAGLGGAIAGIAVFVAIIEFVIAGALFSGKSWGRIVVIIFAILDLIGQAASLLAGNIFGIIFGILDLIVLYYMWRPHVMEYFKGGRSSFFLCKHCKYTAASYRELHNHLLTCEKRNEKKPTKNQDLKNLGVLKERLVKGEISKEEYNELKGEFE